jgi:hypothetical protein
MSELPSKPQAGLSFEERGMRVSWAGEEEHGAEKRDARKKRTLMNTFIFRHSRLKGIRGTKRKYPRMKVADWVVGNCLNLTKLSVISINKR